MSLVADLSIEDQPEIDAKPLARQVANATQPQGPVSGLIKLVAGVAGAAGGICLVGGLVRNVSTGAITLSVPFLVWTAVSILRKHNRRTHLNHLRAGRTRSQAKMPSAG